MAIRPVFFVIDNAPYVKQVNIDFTFYSGFSITQKQKSFQELHRKFLVVYPNHNILEVSSKSDTALGVKLSAFNLPVKTSIREFTVETAFQSSKVFEFGGPYIDLLDKTSREAKKDERLRNSGKLISFEYFGKVYPLEPKDYFYNWLYLNSLNCNKSLIGELMNYTAFTDIEFNPDKSINCQAKAVALYVSLLKKGLLDEALNSQNEFLRIVYGNNCNNSNRYSQNEFQLNNLDNSITLANDNDSTNVQKGVKENYSEEKFTKQITLISSLINDIINICTNEQEQYLLEKTKKLRNEFENLISSNQILNKSDKKHIIEILEHDKNINQ